MAEDNSDTDIQIVEEEEKIHEWHYDEFGECFWKPPKEKPIKEFHDIDYNVLYKVATERFGFIGKRKPKQVIIDFLMNQEPPIEPEDLKEEVKIDLSKQFKISY